MSQDNFRRHWKSLRDYYNPEKLKKIKEDEFLEGAIDNVDLAGMPPISRRRFLALLSVSSAFAFAACSNFKDKGEIVPYNKKPEEIIIGNANFYASSLNCCQNTCSILVKTREGRPIKIDGNPDHPINQGKVCIRGQAAILNLYDPDRLKSPLQKVSKRQFAPISWREANKSITDGLNKAVLQNKEIAFISNKTNSPTTLSVLKEFQQKYPTTKFYFYSNFSNKTKFEAWKEIYGTNSLPSIKLQQAKIIVALESDFLNTDGDVIDQVRQFAVTRNVNDLKNFSRLYVVEGNLTLTGANSDYRLRLRPDFQKEFLAGLLNEILNRVNPKISLPSELVSQIKNYSLSSLAAKLNLSKDVIDTLVNDLLNNQGRSIIICGDRLGKEEHLLALILNEVLGNSQLYDFNSVYVNLVEESSIQDFEELISKINQGQVGAVINFDCNPVYDFSFLRISDVFEKVGLVVTLSEQKTETTALSNFILPIHNELESWNDFQVRSNIINLQQPVISPMYDTRQKESILITWTTGEVYYDSIYQRKLKSRWQKEVFPQYSSINNFDTFWYACLHDGFLKLPGNNVPKPNFAARSFNISNTTKSNEILLSIYPHPYLFDGKFGNNGWLHEVPHPVTKIVWDNYAAVSPNTAKKLDLKNGDLIQVSNGKNSIELPVFVQAGVAENLICVETGYGREECGEIGKGVGFNVQFLINKNQSSIYNSYVSIKKTGEKYNLVTAQEHHSIDDTFVKDFHRKRKIIQEGTIQQYENDPDFIRRERAELISIVHEVKYEGVKWAMAIDMNKCIGCNACVVSCVAENNIPMVGKDQVEKGREMHWMRIDTYYSGNPEEVIVSNQPMLCQHCDNAPCENVCPVSATNHSPDGLNQMAYNRCVGTRYCSNNCPYKVRRFNFLDFRSEFNNEYQYQEPLNFLNNPEVTVRSRGVMEKCTFCVQRIMEARQKAIEQGKVFDGSGVMTACQQACPSNAIEFGNMLDKNSEVSKLRNHKLAYYVLEETNVKPNVTYIAKLRNINSESV